MVRLSRSKRLQLHYENIMKSRETITHNNFEIIFFFSPKQLFSSKFLKIYCMTRFSKFPPTMISVVITINLLAKKRIKILLWNSEPLAVPPSSSQKLSDFTKLHYQLFFSTRKLRKKPQHEYFSLLFVIFRKCQFCYIFI